MMKLFLILAIIAGALKAHAAPSEGAHEESGTSDYRIRLDDQESRFNLGIYIQASQFTYMGRALLGNAAEVDATYALRSNLAANVSVAQAVSLEGGLGVLYTGIRAAAQYAFFGDFIRRHSTVVINGARSLEMSTGAAPMLAMDVGMEQLMFNGTNRIMPATGASFGVRYDRTFGSFRVSAVARYGMLLVMSQTASMMTGGIGLIYNF